MDVTELRGVVARAGMDPADYRIMDPPGDSTCCIRRQGRVWMVFFFERGVRRELQRFSSEGVACAYFLGMLGLVPPGPTAPGAD